MQQSIIIAAVNYHRNLGDLHARGYGMNAMCEKYRHRGDLDMQALIDQLGAGFVYVHPGSPAGM